MRIRNIFPVVIILGVISLVVLTVLLIKGVQQPQNPIPGRAEEGWQHFEDNDPKFFYMNDPNCWKIVTSGSASYHQADHKNPTHPQCGPVVNQWAKFDTTGSGINFDKFRLGYAPWTYGALINISADGTQINQLNTNDQNISGMNRRTKVWESSNIACGEHEIDLRLDPKQRSGADTIDLDFIEVHTCIPGGGGGNEGGNNGGGDNGGGGNGGGDNGPAVAEEGEKCQGNPKASARCFDCKKDASGDQVNILDFSCFAKWYGQDVGKP